MTKVKARTKGTSVEFKIPSGARIISIKRHRTVKGGASEFCISVNTKGGVETSGYLSPDQAELTGILPKPPR